MNMHDAATMFWSGIGLLAVWGLWSFAWRNAMIEEFRQNLFKIRDDLFDLAAESDGGLKFNNRAYGRMRNTLNSMIRHAHAFTWSRFIWTLATSKKSQPLLPQVSFAELIENVNDPYARSELQKIYNRFIFATLKHLVKTSPVFFPFYLYVRVQSTRKISPAIQSKIEFEVESIVQEDGPADGLPIAA